MLVLGVTALAAACFPYRSKTIYDSAPAPVKRRLLGVPVVTLAGLLGAGMSFAMVIAGLTTKELGLANTTARVLLGGAFASGIVIFYVWRALQARRGIDLRLAFRELPPD